MNNCAYIGAGLDISPAIFFQNIKKFIFIDSLPNCEHGYLNYPDIDMTLFYRPQFMTKLNNIMDINNFKLYYSTDKYKIFIDDHNRVIKYYFNFNFPEDMTKEVFEELQLCNVLYVSGHDPHVKILKYIGNLKYLVGSCHTVYDTNENDLDENKKSTFYHLNNDDSIVENYYLLQNKDPNYWEYEKVQKPENFILIQCADLKDFEKTRKLIKYVNKIQLNSN